jgi:hypothetical protein
MSAKQLAELLDDRRPAVVHRAMHLLGKKGAGAVPALANVLEARFSPTARTNAVWAATRIDHPSARRLVRQSLVYADDTERQAALHSVSLWRDRGAMEDVILLASALGKSAHVMRVAAEALGRMGDATAVAALLHILKEPAADRFLEHSRIYALIEIGDRAATAKGLGSDSPRVRKAALIALDQMPGGKLEVGQVTAALKARNQDLKEAAWWIAGRHPEWGGALASFLRDRMKVKDMGGAEADELVAQLSRFAKNAAIQEMLAGRLRDSSRQERLLALRAMAGSALKPVPAAWVAGLTEALTGEPDVIRAALAAARALPLTRDRSAKLVERLHELAGDAKQPAELRLAALAAVPGGIGDVKPDTLRLLLAKLDREQPVVERALAVEVLVKARLSQEQLLTLADALKGAGPMELDKLLDAFTKTNDAKVGLRLVGALTAATSRTSLRVDGLKTRLAK